jgi:hypothetical protein
MTYGTYLFLILEGSSICLLNQNARGIDSLLLSNFGILLVLGQGFDLRSCWAAIDSDRYAERALEKATYGGTGEHEPLVFDNGPMPWSDGVNNLLVDSPDRIPLERDGCLRWTLKQHELCQSFDSHAPSSNTYVNTINKAHN